MVAAPPPAAGAQEGDLKTSQRVAANLLHYRMNEEPIHVDCDEIGADWCNRMGSQPNILVCHQVLARSFKNDGYDPTKPQLGVCRCFKDDHAKLQKLIAWNETFNAGDDRFPPMNKDKMHKGSLACTHVNMTGRMFKHGMTSRDGTRCTTEKNNPLQELVRLGHKWHVLRSDTPDDVATEISTWFNSTNNSAQVSHEIEHIRGLQRVCKKELETNKVMTLSTVVVKAMQDLKLKSQSSVLCHLARWVTMQGCAEYVDKLCSYHSAEVNPNELTVNPALFGEVAVSLPKNAVDIKLDIMTLAYNPKNRIEKVEQEQTIVNVTVFAIMR